VPTGDELEAASAGDGPGDYVKAKKDSSKSPVAPQLVERAKGMAKYGAGYAAADLIRRSGAGIQNRLRLGLIRRPAYAYCVYRAASLAKRLGYSRISALEFGVAGGNGLIALEEHAVDIGREIGVDIEVFGFDTGAGLPPPTDYRDLPYQWQEGSFSMDEESLRDKLSRAKLVLGDIRDTATHFPEEYQPAPIGAVMFDLDLYSSTKAAMAIFDSDERYRLPRVFCYFDDIIGGEDECYSDFTGERLAIEEFNQTHPGKKLSVTYNLTTKRMARRWFHQIYVLHDFEHTRYNDFVSESSQQLGLH
jgi:hypothetical protein